MSYFGIQNSPLTDQIHIGLLDPQEPRFLDGSDIIDVDDELQTGMAGFLTDLQHEDHTDRVLRVVADHILGDRSNGGLVVEYKDGVTYEITVSRTSAAANAEDGSVLPKL